MFQNKKTCKAFLIVTIVLAIAPQLLNASDPYFPKALQYVEQSNTDGIASMLRDHFNINSTDADGNTLLHHAALFGKTDVASFLIKRKANINTQNNEKQTPLMLAAQKNNDVIWVLIGNKAATQYLDSHHKNAAAYATSSGVKNVLSAPSTDEALFEAVNYNLGVPAVKALLMNKANPNFIGQGGTTPVVLMAIMRNNLPVIKELVNAGANLNVNEKTNYKGKIVKRSAKDLAKQFASKSPELQAYVKKISESYSHIISHQVKDSYKSLKELLPDSSTPKSILNSLLLEDIQELDEDTSPTTIKMLLALGADPNYRNPENNDPVAFIAIARFNIDVLKTLVAAGANLDVKDRFGRSAIDWAEARAPRGWPIKNYIVDHLNQLKKTEL